MQLDQALQWAVTLSWDDLMKPAAARSIRVEYLCEPGCSLDHLSVWSVKDGGYQDLICDYWTSTFSEHSAGARFAGRNGSDNAGVDHEKPGAVYPRFRCRPPRPGFNLPADRPGMRRSSVKLGRASNQLAAHCSS